MPSHLRLQSSFEEPITANATYQTSPKLPPAKKQKMSLTQTYYIASTARSKLGREASKADHNLRRLVAHANTLDTLMEELSRAEQEQSAWFDESIRTASQPEQPRRVQWLDTVAEQYEEDESESDDDSDADSDYDEEEELFTRPNIKAAAIEIDEDQSELDEDEEEEELQLRRSPSQHSPPELTHDDSDSESEDDAPSSPEDAVLQLSEKQRQAIATTALFELKSQRQGMEDYVQQQQQQQPCIAAC